MSKNPKIYASLASLIFPKHHQHQTKYLLRKNITSKLLNENSTDETADEMKIQSKANMQGEDHYLLLYRGTYLTPPYSDKMSREREWGWDHKKERVIKKQRRI